MADLPTNYLDDILSASMNGKKKFRLTYRNGKTEEVTIEDISEYDQYGSKFGAGDINKTNQAVNEKFDSGYVVDPMLTTEQGFAADALAVKNQLDEQNKNLNNLGGFTPIIDETGKITGYKTSVGGADTVFPFSDKDIKNPFYKTFGIVRNTTYNIVSLTNLNPDNKHIICFSHNRRTASTTSGWNGNANISTDGTVETIVNGQTNQNGFYVYMGSFIISNATYISITTSTTGDESDCTVFGFEV